MITAHIRRLTKHIDAMSLRERVLVFVAITGSFLLGWYQFAMLPVLQTEEKAVAAINTARDRIRDADSAVHAQARALGVNGAWTVETQLDEARRRADEIDALISARAAEIVDPATMAQVLEDILSRQQQLRLIRAHNLQAQQLPNTGDTTPLYRHTLQLELEGSYLAVLDYLEALEALPWRIYWQAIEIDTLDYPRNRVTIKVSTLSFDQEWIGV